jgi:proline dehydrogenase
VVDFSGVLKRLPGRADVAAAMDRVPVAREAASPFVAGETVATAVRAVGEVLAEGMGASVLYLPMPDAQGAARLVHMQVIGALAEDDLAAGTDLSVDPTMLGLGQLGPDAVRAEVGALCAAASDAGMTITLTGLSHDLVDEGLALRAELADEFPDLGVTLGANLLRTEGDCLDLASTGARVRLIKRQAVEAASVAFGRAHDVDKAYVRCMRLLMDAGARTTVATHDTRLVEIAAALAERADREPGHYGYQFRRGVATDLAAELVAAGSAVSLLVPFGPDWAGYLSRRVPLTASSVGQAARAAVGRGSAQ